MNFFGEHQGNLYSSLANHGIEIVPFSQLAKEIRILADPGEKAVRKDSSLNTSYHLMSEVF